MTDGKADRQLVAIMVVDVVGYSRLMGDNEEHTLDVLKRLRRNIVGPQLAAYRGRIVKLMGDGAIILFSSVVDAVNAAVCIQEAMDRFECGDADQPMRLRIGLNLCDVIREGSDIYGDGVNITARLQEICRPGGIVLSASAYEQVRGKIGKAFSDEGLRDLKNISQPVHVYQWPAEVQTGVGAKSVSSSFPSLPDKPSIAVLPFDNMSKDPEQAYFADGVVEALTAALSRIRSFFVIARNSAFEYKGTPKNVGQIGRELGVAYLIEGSVQRAPGKLRITVQLIETHTGAHLWAERYDGSDDDIFDLQDRITEQVAGAIHPSIQKAEIERISRKRPEDLGAYDYTMRAMRHVWKLDKEQTGQAIELLNKAIEIDGDYPLALALVAWCWAQRSVYNWVDDIAEAKVRSLGYAERAASLSSDDPLILAVLGAAHTFARNFGAARVLLERAISLDENAAWAHSRLGWLEVYSDRPEQAIPYFERAIRLSPMDPMNFNNYVGMGSAHQVMEDYGRAADLYSKAITERPTAYWLHRNLAPVLLAAGRKSEAEASARVLVAEYPDFTISQFKQAMVFSDEAMERLAVFLRQLGFREE
ncbi:MAG: tetratricopeptide repeat protein [Pseudomonadota bacterium]